MSHKRGWLLIGFLIVMAQPDLASARAKIEAPPQRPHRAQAAVATPYNTNLTHRIGNVAFTVTNWGFFGSETRLQRDPCTGLPAESFEFPRGSGIEYLFQGAVWIGAVKGRDTLVSVGADGWYDIHEFFPRPYPE